MDDLRGIEIVVPGAMTTAFLTLRLALGDLEYRELPFEKIPDEVASGRAEAGLLIHEGQLTFREHGLTKVLDLGEWWLLETGLPLPLGVTVARRDVERLRDLSAVLRDAIECGLDHREDALEYALQFGRGIDAAVADRFVSMYVNDLTQEYGDEGRSAVAEILRRGEEIGAFPGPVKVDWIELVALTLERQCRARREQDDPDDARPVECDAVETEPSVPVDRRRRDELPRDEQPHHGGRPDPRTGDRDREHDERTERAARQHPPGLRERLAETAEPLPCDDEDREHEHAGDDRGEHHGLEHADALAEPSHHRDLGCPEQAG